MKLRSNSMGYIKKAALLIGLLVGIGVFGAASIAGARIGEIMGVIANGEEAQLSAQDQAATDDSVTIARVAAPQPSFVVLHTAGGGMPGMRVRYARVPAGVSENVVVKLDTHEPTPQLVAALHIDRGEAGEFEFDMEDAERSPDKPYFVDGKAVQAPFAVREFEMDMKDMLDGPDQPFLVTSKAVTKNVIVK